MKTLLNLNAHIKFIGTAAFIQLQAEIDSDKIEHRLRQFEDPISYLHEDVPALSKEIYQKLSTDDSIHLKFEEDFYNKFSRPLAALAANNLISEKRGVFRSIPCGINLTDPTYILYMCRLAEDQNKMQKLFDLVDNCKRREWLNSEKLKGEIGLPECVVKAVFQIYESKGYGALSKTNYSYQYRGTSSKTTNR
ncbi:hypothetical protein GMJAKD_11625 [Candidatus Electrothrix aarhusensis]